MKRNIKLYFLMMLFFNLWFAAPIFFIFERSLGFSFFQIGILEAVFAISAVLLEIPSGVFADKYGRKISLIISGVLHIISYLFYSFGSTFWIFFIAQLFGGLSLAFFSGAGEALLYDTLLSEKKQKLYAKYSGKGYIYSGIGLAVSALAASLLVKYGMRTTIYATLLPLAVVTILAFFYIEPKRKKLSAIHIQKKSLELIKNNPTVKRVIIFYWLAFGIPLSAIMIFNQPLLQEYGLPLNLFGIVFLVTGAFAALGSWLAHKIEKLNAFKTYLTMLIIGILMLIIAGYNSIYTFLFSLIIFYLLFGLITVLVPSHLNHATPSSHRATVLSYGNMGRQVFIAIFVILMGAVRTNFNYSYVLISTIVLLLIFLIFFLTWKKHLNKSL